MERHLGRGGGVRSREGGWNGLVLCQESREGRLCVGQALSLSFAGRGGRCPCCVGKQGPKVQRREAVFAYACERQSWNSNLACLEARLPSCPC